MHMPLFWELEFLGISPSIVESTGMKVLQTIRAVTEVRGLNVLSSSIYPLEAGTLMIS